MTGREDKKSNDLFFTCSLIDYIARKTKNRRCDIVDALGRESIEMCTTVITLRLSVMILLKCLAFKKEILTMFPQPNMRFQAIGILARYTNV